MIKIIDNQKDLCLKLGDIVTHNNDKDIYIVIETWKYCSDEIVYALKNIYQDAPCVEIADESLENLTKRAITLGYKIYNQDDYDMIIRRKNYKE